MKLSKIKTSCASISINKDNTIFVCLKYKSKTLCIQFASIEKLKQVVEQRKLVVKKWAMTIPRNLCILRSLSLPASDLSEALTMIEFELPSIIPLPVDEIVYATSLLSQQDNMLNVLVCIIKLSALQEYLKPYINIGIEPQKIILDSLAIQNWINTTNNIKSEPVISALINTKGVIVQTCVGENFQKANELTFSGNNFQTFANDVVNELVHQREELFASLKDQVIFVLAGLEEFVSEVKNLLSSVIQDTSKINTVTIISGLDILDYNGEAKFTSQDKEVSTEIITSIGLLDLTLNSKLPESNLLPRQYTKNRRKKALFKKHILIGLMVLLLILLVWSSLFASNRRIKRLSEIIESQIAPIEDISRAVETKRQRVRAIQGQLSHKGQITAIINELYNITPNTISISKLKYSSGYENTYIDIDGQADTIETAYKYTGKDKAKLLKQLQSKDAQQIHQAGGSIVVFSAHCDILDN